MGKSAEDEKYEYMLQKLF